MAREAQVQEALSKFADQNNKQLLSILKEVFGESDAENPKEMKILVRRIPILCTNIENMHKAIEEMRANQSWVIKLIIGAVIAAVMAVVLK